MNPPTPKLTFIIHSKDSYFIEEQINKKALFLGKSKKSGKSRQPCTVNRFRIPQDPPARVLDALQTPDFFSGNTIVVVYNYDQQVKKPQLLEWLNIANSQCLLYLVKNEAKFNSKAFEAVVRTRQDVDVTLEYFVKEERLLKRFRKTATKHNLNFSKEAEEKLMSYFVATPSMYRGELDKIICYFYQRTKPIEVQHLAKIASFQDEVKEFSVIDSIFDQKPALSIPHFENYIRMQGNFHLLLMFLQNETEKILRFAEMLNAGVYEQRAFVSLRIFYDKAKKSLLKRSKKFTMDQLYRFLAGLYEVERVLKETGFSHHRVGEPAVNLRSKIFFYRVVQILFS